MLAEHEIRSWTTTSSKRTEKTAPCIIDFVWDVVPKEKSHKTKQNEMPPRVAPSQFDQVLCVMSKNCSMCSENLSIVGHLVAALQPRTRSQCLPAPYGFHTLPNLTSVHHVNMLKMCPPPAYMHGVMGQGTYLNITSRALTRNVAKCLQLGTKTGGLLAWKCLEWPHPKSDHVSTCHDFATVGIFVTMRYDMQQCAHRHWYTISQNTSQSCHESWRRISFFQGIQTAPSGCLPSSWWAASSPSARDPSLLLTWSAAIVMLWMVE